MSSPNSSDKDENEKNPFDEDEEDKPIKKINE